MTRPRDSLQHGDRFRVLFEHSSDARFIFDENGTTDCNDATVKLLKASDKAHVLSLHPAYSHQSISQTAAARCRHAERRREGRATKG